MAPLPILLDRLLPRIALLPGAANDAQVESRSSQSIAITPESLFKRDASTTANVYKREQQHSWNPGAGSKPPESFNNQAYFALFALIGALMVLASLWFFFWSKNGGFHFQDGDWDDYKSTVLRRKGPDGRTLSNATKSTKLGGSTIAGTQHYKWAKQEARSVVGRDEKGRKGVLGKRGWAKTHSITYSDDYTSYGTRTTSDMTEVREMPTHSTPQHQSQPHSKRYRDRDVQEYKRERPARVGGLNRVADGSHIDTDHSDIYSETSERPILQKQKQQQEKNQERERAERRARVEAAKMEHRWKKEAEEAAAALAREDARAIPAPKKAASPTKPSAAKQRSSSRSASPKKRDFSYQPDPEILSTAYTGSNSESRRTASYYDMYRPAEASENVRYSPERTNRSRQSSPKKKAPARSGREGGYRRGADSDLD